MILYRPVGLQELELIYDSGMKAFPARLPQQPIFYPVLDVEYARQVASDWNVKSGQLAGYVTQFKVEDSYIGQFEQHTVGGSQHQEFWIPAEEMDEFNRHIMGHIKVLEAYFGEPFQGFVPEKFGLQGMNAIEQFTQLTNSYIYKRMDFYLEIKRNHKAVFLNYPFWLTHDFKNPGLKEKIIKVIKEAWFTSFPNIPLPLPPPVQQDTSINQETDPHQPAQDLADSAEEDVTPVEETDSSNAVEEDSTPEEQIDSYSLVNPDDQQITSKQHTDSYSMDDPDDENFTLAKQFYPHSSASPGREEITRRKQTDPSARHLSNAEDNDEHRASAEQQDLPSLTNRVDKDSTPIKQTPSHFVQGIRLGLSGKYHEAIDELTKAVEENPNDVVAHTSLGVAFGRVGEDDRALACYETALKIDPIDAEAHYFRASILYGHGNVREAISAYTVALGLKPELIEAHQKPGPENRLTDYSPTLDEIVWIARPAHRILELNQSLETPGAGQANLFKERAAEYDRLRNYAQAIADYNSSLALQPDDAEAFHFRGLAYEKIGQSERALEDYQRAIAIDPQLSDVYLNRGVIFGRMGNFRQSIASLTESVRLTPKNPDAYFNRGTSYFQLGDLESAIADFSHVIRLSPGDEAAYYWRGVSHEEAGRQRDAIADYNQFLTLSQDELAKMELEGKLRQWNEADRKSASRQSVIPEEGQGTKQIPSERPDRNIDLHDVITALGERALQSTWFGSSVECYGEQAEQLYEFTDQERPIDGRDFLSIASGIRQMIQGDFFAFDPGATSYWLYLRAWEGSGFYIETDDPNGKQRLKAHFPSVEEVDGAIPPYEGLFIPI